MQNLDTSINYTLLSCEYTFSNTITKTTATDAIARWNPMRGFITIMLNFSENNRIIPQVKSKHRRVHIEQACIHSSSFFAIILKESCRDIEHGISKVNANIEGEIMFHNIETTFPLVLATRIDYLYPNPMTQYQLTREIAVFKAFTAALGKEGE